TRPDRNLGDAPSFGQSLLPAFKDLTVHFRCRTAPRLGFIKSLRPVLAIHFHVPLHGDHRHPKRLDDLFRLHASYYDHLTRERAETLDIGFLVLKYRQMTVHVTHLSVFGIDGHTIINLGKSGWKDRQLHLWHAFLAAVRRRLQTIFRLILISSTAGKVRR